MIHDTEPTSLIDPDDRANEANIFFFLVSLLKLKLCKLERFSSVYFLPLSRNKFAKHVHYSPQGSVVNHGYVI